MSIIIMILLLGLLIFVHEMGHFIAARSLGIKVSKFAIGFPIGPTLWSKKIGDVEYLIHACLLGGYVAFPDDEKDSDLPLDSKERFVNNPIWKRMIVISAGVIMNIIIAFVLVGITAIAWGQLPGGEAQVYVNKIVAPKEASIWNSGMKDGDRIIAINGSPIKSSYALTMYTKNSKKYDGKVDEAFALKNLEKLEKLNPQIKNGLVKKGQTVKLFAPVDEPEIKIENSALKGLGSYKSSELSLSQEQISMRKELNGEKKYTPANDTSLKDIAYALSDGYKPLHITVLREGKNIELKTIYPDETGMIGIQLEDKQVLTPTKTPKQIITGTWNYISMQTYNLLYGFWVFFTGKVPASSMHGVVAFAKVGGDIINQNGIFSGLLLTALISIDLAILNFLPIPALDGGHFMFMIIEKLRGRPVAEKTLERLSTIFFTLLIVLGILVIFNDIYALVMHKL